MPINEDDVRDFLSKRNIPGTTFIVPQDITFVSAVNVRKVEVFGFISSLILLLAGVFLGVILTPNSPLFYYFFVCGLIMVICGVIVFIVGVHREINEWERKKIRLV